jgi:ribosomal protein S12 methylthiotransferase
LGVWVRLHYVYPYPHVDDLIPLMAEGSVLPYLDIPFQHGSPRILKRMRRPAAAEDTLRRIEAWRAVCPEIALRSSFIVGFPGETETDFEVLLDFLSTAQLDRVGCFQYSPVDGAKANDLPDPVPSDVKKARYHRLMQTQLQISRERLRARIGQRMEILVDEVADGLATARSYADAPEIDGKVHIGDPAGLRAGDRCRVLVEEAGDYDVWGRLLDMPALCPTG